MLSCNEDITSSTASAFKVRVLVMKTEKQDQYSPTYPQVIVLLERDYYNGGNSEDGSKKFTVQLCHPGNTGPIYTMSKAETNNPHLIFTDFSACPRLLWR